MEAVWIERSQREHAQTLGYTVVDASTVVATHLSQCCSSTSHELLGHEEVQQLLQKLAKMAPKLAEDLVPGTLTMNQLLGVLQNLLSERVPIRNIRSIAEAIAAQAVRSKDPAALSAAARVALGRTIVQQISGNATSLPVITLEPQMEQVLMKSLQRGGAAGAESEDIVLEPGLAERLQRSMNEAAQRQEVQGKAPVLLVPAPLRAVLARFMRHTNRATRSSRTRKFRTTSRSPSRRPSADETFFGAGAGATAGEQGHGTQANHRPGREDGVAARARAARSRRHDPVQPPRARRRRDRRRPKPDTAAPTLPRRGAAPRASAGEPMLRAFDLAAGAARRARPRLAGARARSRHPRSHRQPRSIACCPRRPRALACASVAAGDGPTVPAQWLEMQSELRSMRTLLEERLPGCARRASAC